MDEESAKNTLTFFGRIDFNHFCDANKETDIIKKSFAMIYSAFDFYYLRDANLFGASFDCKGCEKLAMVPPFSIQGLGGRGSRGKNGKVSVREQDLT